MEQISVDHDRLFKALLTHFFTDFVQAFLPSVAAYIEFDTIEFLDKEIFTDLTSGERREVDLIVKARFRGQDTCFIIHVENQATAQADFPQRMFFYFARLHEKYGLPIYPVVIFSYDRPLRPEPNRYAVVFPGETVLQFKYKVIQLNRLSWRKFLKTPNPAAAALMTKMNIAPNDRIKVTREIIRMIATLKLDPARTQLIGLFMETYLKLTADEMRQYRRKYETETRPEEEKNVELEFMTSWAREGMAKGMAKGMEQGRQQGVESVVARLISKRFGVPTGPFLPRLDLLTAEQLGDLSEALLDFTSVADLEDWLTQHPGQREASAALVSAA